MGTCNAVSDFSDDIFDSLNFKSQIRTPILRGKGDRAPITCPDTLSTPDRRVSGRLDHERCRKKNLTATPNDSWSKNCEA